MKNRIHIEYFKTGFGELIIGSMDHHLCLCDWRYRKTRVIIDQRIQTGLGAGYVEEGSETIEETKSQLSQYFKGERTRFDLPFHLVGSAFQREVWNALLRIPYGETETYAGLSAKMGNVKAIRAVAGANGANAISMIVPCHRILGSDGALIGYAGGVETKRRLLRLENAWYPGSLFGSVSN